MLCCATWTQRRDWGFAGDYVEAMWLMLQHDAPDDYVVATGTSHSVQRFPGIWLLLTRWLAAGKDHCRNRPASTLKPSEVDHLLGDASKANTELGWSPSTSFEELVMLMVDADLQAESKQAGARPPADETVAAAAADPLADTMSMHLRHKPTPR